VIVRYIRSKAFKNMGTYYCLNIFKQQQRWLLLRARPCECIPHRHFWPGVRWCWEWNAGALCLVGGWVADPLICEITLYRSILDIISQTHHTGGLQCFKGDGGCVSMLVCSNSFTACDAKWPGERSHSRRNSSCILVAITSRNSCIYIYIYIYLYIYIYH